MVFINQLVVGLGFCLASASAHSAAEWTERVIYQVLTDRIAYDGSQNSQPCADLSKYCGGTWNGITQQLDYIAGMGFDAIWISPMLLNLNNDYHGYAFLDLYKVNDHFGTDEELKNLITQAHARDMWIMLDVVGNHVAPVDLSFEKITPFNESKYYHTKCQIEDWSNQEQVENCRLSNLPDLDQNNEFVRSTLLNWVGSLKEKYDFDGLRVDTVCEVHGDFWGEFSAQAGMYTIGEVFNGDINYVSQYQQYLDGMLSYPLYFTMMDVFARQQSMYAFEGLLGPSGSYYSKFSNLYALGNFIDNHDNARFLYSQPSWTLYKNALTMTLMNIGIPIVYYGSEQGYHGGNDPLNRESLWPNYSTSSELYSFIQTLISTRKAQNIAQSTQIQRYASTDLYSFSRGDVLVCLTNSNGSKTVSVTLTYLPYHSGDVVCNALDVAECLTVTSNGLTVTMTNGLPKVYTKKVS